jgi:hypothetical protein
MLYVLGHQQVAQFIQMISNLSSQPAQNLRPELGGPSR